MSNVLISLAIFCIQITLLIFNKRGIAESELLIYLLLSSLAMTAIYFYTAVLSMSRNQPLYLTAISSLKTAMKGAAAGYAFGATCVALFLFIDDVQFYRPAISAMALIKAGALSIFAGTFEELIYRGMLLHILIGVTCYFKRRIEIITNVIQALIFAATHSHTSQFQDSLYPIFVFIMGIVLGHFAIKERSLWFPIGFHCSWNFLNCMIFGIHFKKILTPESGLFLGYVDGEKFTAISLTLGVSTLFGLLLMQRLHKSNGKGI